MVKIENGLITTEWHLLVLFIVTIIYLKYCFKVIKYSEKVSIYEREVGVYWGRILLGFAVWLSYLKVCIG